MFQNDEGKTPTADKPEPRYIVATKSAKYINGNANQPMLSFTAEQARASAAYFTSLGRGNFGAFELTPITFDEAGNVVYLQ